MDSSTAIIMKKFKLNSDAMTKSQAVIMPILPKKRNEKGMMKEAGNLRDVTVPDEVGFEELDSIGNILERVLPDPDIAAQHTSPPDLSNEYNQLMDDCKQRQKIGDSDLLRQRQEAAMRTMTANGINTDKDTIPSNMRTRCQVCGKDRNTFTFQDRKHLQINKREKGVIIQWYCPLVDPPERYDDVHKQRRELERAGHKRRNRKRLKLKSKEH